MSDQIVQQKCYTVSFRQPPFCTLPEDFALLRSNKKNEKFIFSPDGEGGMSHRRHRKFLLCKRRRRDHIRVTC